MQRIFDLAQKEVINIDDGARLGRISDVEIDELSGKIKSIIIMGKQRAFGLLGREAELVIPWELINRIGNDAILVRIGVSKGK